MLTDGRPTDGRRSDWYTISSPMSLWLRWAKNNFGNAFPENYSRRVCKSTNKKKFWPYYMGAATSNWCTVIVVYNLYLLVQIEFFSRYSEVDL